MSAEVLPFNPLADHESERAVLGAVMLDNATLPAVEGQLRVEHFEHGPHRLIYAAVLGLAASGTPVDLVTVVGSLRERAELEDVGGPAYVSSLVDGIPRTASAEAWAKRVREKARRRAAITIAERLISQARGAEHDTDTLLDKHAADLSRLLEAGDRRIVSLSDVLPAAMKELDEFLAASDGVTGVPTGLLDFDRLTGGLKPGALYIVAARPSRGKSALCAQAAVHAGTQGCRSLVFSMEMEPYQLGQRMLLAEAEVDRWDLRREKGGDRESYSWKKIGQSYAKLTGLPVFFDQRESPNLAQVRASCRQQMAQGLDLVVVDYIQRMTLDPTMVKQGGIWAAVGENVKGLKSLARNLRVPVLAACQLTSEAEEKRPTLAMLQQAQSVISAEADLISFLHPQDLSKWKTQPFPMVDLFVDKHRSGACMAIALSFERSCTRFVSVAREPQGETEWKGELR